MTGEGRIAVGLVCLGVLACTGQAVAQDTGREACLRFLNSGEHAPRPELESLSEAFVRPGMGAPAQGKLTELAVPAQGDTQFTIGFNEQGAVVSYNAFDRAMRLPTSVLADQTETQSAIEKRTRFTERELQRRARVFLRARSPRSEQRVWRRVDSRLCANQNPIWYQVRFTEVAPEGALAIYRNQVVVGLCPERGEVVFYRATHVDGQLTEAPPVSADDAAAAAARFAGDLPLSDPDLQLVHGEDGLSPLWSVVGVSKKRLLVVHVNALTGKATVRRDQRRH